LAEHIGMGFLLYHTLSATQHMKLSKAPVSKSKTRYSKHCWSWLGCWWP